MTGENGWVKIHRKILDNPSLRRLEYLGLWVYILLSVNHVQTRELFAGKEITLNPGQGIFSTPSLAEQMGLSVSKVRRILESFESEQQIEQLKTPRGTVITVLNWGKYQQREQPNEQLVNNCCTTDEQLMNNLPYLKKNIKNVKNGKKVYGTYENIQLTDDELHKLKSEFPDWNERIERLSEYIASTGKKYKNHLATIRSWARRDKQNGTNMDRQSAGKEPGVEVYERVIREAEERRKAGLVGAVPVGSRPAEQGVRTYPWQRKSTV